MQRYEYKVVPAPRQSRRIRGVKTPEGRFAAVLTETINELAAQGWEYLRADSLPVEEKPGLLKPKVETYHTVLVFRRALSVQAEVAEEVSTPGEAGEPMRKPASLRAEPRLGGRSAPVAPAQDEPRLRAERAAERDAAEAGSDEPGAEEAAAEQASTEEESPFAEASDTEREVSR